MQYIEGPRKRQYGDTGKLPARPKSSRPQTAHSSYDRKGKEGSPTRPKTAKERSFSTYGNSQQHKSPTRSKSPQRSKSPTRAKSPGKEQEKPKKRRRTNEPQSEEDQRKSESPAARMLRIYSELRDYPDRARSVTPISGRSSTDPGKSRSNSRASTPVTPKNGHPQRKTSKEESKKNDQEGREQNGARPKSTSKSSKKSRSKSSTDSKQRNKYYSEEYEKQRASMDESDSSTKDHSTRPRSSHPKGDKTARRDSDERAKSNHQRRDHRILAREMAKERSPYLEKQDPDSIQVYHPNQEKPRPKSSKHT